MQGPGSSTPTGSSSGTPKNNSAGQMKRLQTELRQLMMAPPDLGVSAFPDGETFFQWVATMAAPKDSPYTGVKFRLRLQFGEDYPFKPPKVTFVTPIFHPNVSIQDGHICLDILQDKWSASYSVQSLLLSIRSLLTDPNNASPLNTEAANLWSDQEAYRKKVLAMHKENVDD